MKAPESGISKLLRHIIVWCTIQAGNPELVVCLWGDVGGLDSSITFHVFHPGQLQRNASLVNLTVSYECLCEHLLRSEGSGAEFC